MESKVILQRELLGGIIRQDSKSCYFSANDLVEVGSAWRRANGMSNFSLASFLQQKGTKEFIQFLEQEEGCKAIIASRGRNGTTWVHPYLFIEIALALSPELKVKTYKWLYDELVKYRNNSGDSFKKMCGAIQIRIANQKDLVSEIKSVCFRIRKECGVNENMSDKEAWNKATEKQLELRDKIHEYIAQFSDIIQGENLYDIAIKKAKEEVNA